MYVAALRARYRCPCCVLVVAPDARVAAWAGRPIDLGQPGSRFVPLVLGPDRVPVVTEVVATRACPELGVLSVLTHNANEAVARAALAGAGSLYAVDEERATLYNDLIGAALAEWLRVRLEETMGLEGYQYQSEFALKHIAKGRAEGRAEARTEAAARAARAVLAVFEARDMAVPDEARARIEACDDPDQLEVWLERAIKVDSPEGIFAE